MHLRHDSRLQLPWTCGEAPDQRGQVVRLGTHDKLGAESRPVTTAAWWMSTAPAQIGGLEVCDGSVRTTNRGQLIRKGRASRRKSVLDLVDRWGSLESAGEPLGDDRVIVKDRIRKW